MWTITGIKQVKKGTASQMDPGHPPPVFVDVYTEGGPDGFGITLEAARELVEHLNEYLAKR